MEIEYCSSHIDINYISCPFDKLMDALIKLEENYSCSERITINITDRNKEIYIYYKSFSGVRLISPIKCDTMHDLNGLIYSTPKKVKQFKKGFECKKMYNYIISLLNQDKIENKEIHFYCEWEGIVSTYSYQGTLDEINRSKKIIRTTSLANLSFDLIDKGYNIYLHKNDKVFKLKPGMILNGKKIRKEHNLLKMLLAGCFD